jgi:hypothetical protein
MFTSRTLLRAAIVGISLLGATFTGAAAAHANEVQSGATPTQRIGVCGVDEHGRPITDELECARRAHQRAVEELQSRWRDPTYRS